MSRSPKLYLSLESADGQLVITGPLSLLRAPLDSFGPGEEQRTPEEPEVAPGAPKKRTPQHLAKDSAWPSEKQAQEKRDESSV